MTELIIILKIRKELVTALETAERILKEDVTSLKTLFLTENADVTGDNIVFLMLKDDVKKLVTDPKILKALFTDCIIWLRTAKAQETSPKTLFLIAYAQVFSEDTEFRTENAHVIFAHTDPKILKELVIEFET